MPHTATAHRLDPACPLTETVERVLRWQRVACVAWGVDSSDRVITVAGPLASVVGPLMGLTVAEIAGSKDPRHPILRGYRDCLRHGQARYQTEHLGRRYEAHLHTAYAGEARLGIVGIATLVPYGVAELSVLWGALDPRVPSETKLTATVMIPDAGMDAGHVLDLSGDWQRATPPSLTADRVVELVSQGWLIPTPPLPRMPAGVFPASPPKPRRASAGRTDPSDPRVIERGGLRLEPVD